MAIQEHDREDLLRDGRNMPIRGECVSGDTEILIGFRTAGQASLYFGPERVFQFDADGRVRRVYFDGQKYAADAGKLIKLDRETRGGRVELIRQPVDASVESTIVAEVAKAIEHVAAMVVDSEICWRVIGTSHEGFHRNVQHWLGSVSSPPQLGSVANA